MKKRLFNKNFNREHAKAHQDRDLKDTISDLADELQEREFIAQEYRQAWESEKQLRETLTTELGKDINSLMDTARKKVKQAVIASVLVGVAAGGLLGYLVRMYWG